MLVWMRRLQARFRGERLILMPDYHADPVWYWSSGWGASLEDLPISDEIREQLRTWARWYETLMDTGYEWSGPKERDAFEREGRRLWMALRAELRGHYRVGYFSETDGKRVWDPANLSRN